MPGMPLFGVSEGVSEFDPWLRRWDLIPDGDVIETFASRVIPVVRGSERLMLKLSSADEERLGGQILEHWSDGPFVKIHARRGDAVLMERSFDAPSLLDLPDPEAVKIMVEVSNLIHKSPAPVDLLTPLEVRFEALLTCSEGGILGQARAQALELLEHPTDKTPLHGDVHHGNILMFEGGWKAIDPKGVLGERAFDFANLFCNPSSQKALKEGRFERMLELVSEAADVPTGRMTAWVLAWCGLSSIWSIADGQDPNAALMIAQKAASCLKS